MALGIALSWPLASIFDDPSLQPLFAAFSVCFLLASLISVPSALLIRAMHFRALETRVTRQPSRGAAVGIALAFGGDGPWAIVGGEIANRAIVSVTIWLQSRWRPRFMFSRAKLREQFAYGGTLFGAFLLLQFSQTTQSLMVGRLLGETALGRLTVSQTLVYMPFNRVAGPIQQVMFPAFSRMQDEPARILAALNRVNQVIAAIAFPTLTGFAILAPEFTSVVRGAEMEGTESESVCLSIGGMVLALQRVNYSVLRARLLTLDHVGRRWRARYQRSWRSSFSYPFGSYATVVAITVQTILLQAVIDVRHRPSSRRSIPRPRATARRLIRSATVSWR